jgi:hypothetical protein
MSAHDHTTIVPGCYRCDLNKDELPTPLEAAAAVIYDGPATFPSDTSTTREAIEAALDAADLPTVIAEAYTKFLSDPTKPHMTRALSDAVRTALLGADS